jgi:hypothetical protein
MYAWQVAVRRRSLRESRLAASRAERDRDPPDEILANMVNSIRPAIENEPRNRRAARRGPAVGNITGERGRRCARSAISIKPR